MSNEVKPKTEYTITRDLLIKLLNALMLRPLGDVFDVYEQFKKETGEVLVREQKGVVDAPQQAQEEAPQAPAASSTEAAS